MDPDCESAVGLGGPGVRSGFLRYACRAHLRHRSCMHHSADTYELSGKTAPGVNMEFSRKDEVVSVSMSRPHVVLLGAGASRACMPEEGLPLMADFIEVVGLRGLLEEAGIAFQGKSFEEVYSDLHCEPRLDPIRKTLETAVWKYFASLQLPTHPTVYDYLVLCLRGKDVIATFNWDPLLFQEYHRNLGVVSLPQMLFLHGNVAVGYCLQDKVLGTFSDTCRHCRQLLKPTRLLYPVKEKNYERDPILWAQWQKLRMHMSEAFMFTVFGYSAPQSDVAAIELLQQGWGSRHQRVMEQVEIVDLKPEDELRRVWSRFIHSHHYSVTADFFGSWVAQHPRRTGEAHMAQFVDMQCVDGNPAPQGVTMKGLHEWFVPLHRAEIEAAT